jgi:hypothetical protein
MNTLLTLVFLLGIQIMHINAIIPENPAFTLPDEIDGWEVDDAGLWDEQTLYTYINGGAELYLSHSFELAASRRYMRGDEPEIMVDLFRMATPDDAYAVFSLSSEKENARFGENAQEGPGMLLFRKHRYCVSVVSYPVTEASQAAVHRLARLIEQAIPEGIGDPALVTHLPKQERRDGSVRYFRHHAWQNVYGLIAHDDILHIGDSAEIAAARYGEGEHAATLYLLRYPDTATAAQGLAGWHKRYGGADEQGILDRDNRYYAARQRQEFLLLVHDAADRETTETLLERTLQNFE